VLHLLHAPAWAPPDAAPRPLPLTLPSALLVVLATEGRWMAREQLALIFWPDAAPADALHHLRINLHRARQALAAWGQAEALQAERARLRLDLPGDVAQLRAAQAAGDASALARLNPTRWLQGWRLAGSDGFAQWCDDTAAQLQADWLAASRRCQPGAAQPPAVPPGVRPALSAGPPAPPGREAELQRLLHSPAPALLLVGEPGAGKTTLLHAAHPQAPLLRGLEGLHALPYRPLLATLREHTPLLERALREPSHPLRPYRLDLARALPELAPDEALPPLDALTAQTRLIEALTRAFEALTPVLVVDDLQWLDSASIDWLLMLAHSGRLRWRAAARRHEVGPDLQRALDSLHRAARLETVDVPPLGRAALARACALHGPDRVHDEAQLDRLHALSGGNAFLLGELVNAGWAAEGDAPSAPVQARVARLVLARLHGLPEALCAAVQAAAVFVQPVPPAALNEQPSLAATEAQSWAAACKRAVDAGLLCEDSGGLACRHDLVRQAVTQSLSAKRLVALHRHAALWLAEQDSPSQPPDALTIAEHWRAAGEAQTALAWCHRGAEQLKARGSFDEARALWRSVADESLDAAQGLRAQLELAACDLFEDLSRGEAALEAVQARLGAVADPEQHRQIEGRLRAALVDNRVFAGDIARARVHAERLRTLLPALPVHEQVDAVEVLIELAMREPDIPGAWALLAQLRALAPQRPTLLSFEGQIHWFGGQVQAAHDALARLLARHPDYCRGITVENDLAVMLQALGRIDEAEVMARRSLQSWAGVAHTETLSLLALGLVLTSAGRHPEADAALLRALDLAREQASRGFEAEALVRRARLLLQMGQADEAQQALDIATPLLADSPEPLRVSQWALARVQAACATGRPWPGAVVARLQAVAAGSEHPLVHVRLARVAHAQALAAQDAAAAAQSAARMADTARRAGLLEALADALLLQAQAQPDAAEAPAWTREAARLAALHGYADIRRRAASPQG
jgi:tetratricopeptide (TPR) repeat protein